MSKSSKIDGYSYYMVEDDQNDRDDELKSRVLTRAPPCMMNPSNNHDITDLLDEVLDSDDDSDGMFEGCAMEVDKEVKKQKVSEVFSLFDKKSKSKSKSLENIPDSVVTVLSAAARASNTSLDKLGYDTDDKMDENDQNNENAENAENLPETDKMDDDSGNSSKNSSPNTQKTTLPNLTIPQKSTADELLEDQQEFLDLFKNGKYGLQADELYDNEADDLDEKFAEKNNLVKPKGSDAILSCGRCFTVICVDCQKHTKYENQYRAMFVLEGRTSILPDKIIKYRKKELVAGGKRRPVNKKRILGKKTADKKGIEARTSKQGDQQNEEEVDDGDFGDPRLYDHYFQVICEECKAEIGVYDKDEVYHFYDVCA